MDRDFYGASLSRIRLTRMNHLPAGASAASDVPWIVPMNMAVYSTREVVVSRDTCSVIGKDRACRKFIECVVIISFTGVFSGTGEYYFRSRRIRPVFSVFSECADDE